jgi:pimeloyl-ACP methyl ester carboxylesterase
MRLKMPVARINDHDLYYELHGAGAPAICLGGWGTYCHGGEHHLARGLTDRYQVLIIDYRGIGDSSDDPHAAPTMMLHANDVIGLLDHLGWRSVHFVGLVGMGACIAQEVAIRRPDLVRSMVNMGAWAKVDPYLEDQLTLFRDIHRDSGFAVFQRHVCVMSFTPEFYNANRERLLGPQGPWRELNGRIAAHTRLVAACIAHDSAGHLGQIRAPTLIIHAGLDLVTSPRTTLPLERGIPGATGIFVPHFAHVVAGREQKVEFSKMLMAFLENH